MIRAGFGLAGGALGDPVSSPGGLHLALEAQPMTGRHALPSKLSR